MSHLAALEPGSVVMVSSLLMPPSDMSKAHFAAMKSDLKNLASQQEIYFSDHGQYTSDFEAMGFTQSNGVDVTLHASAEGWTAQAKHAELENTEGCAINYYYDGEARVPITQLDGVEPGQVVCTR